jgi:hypothetical protein
MGVGGIAPDTTLNGVDSPSEPVQREAVAPTLTLALQDNGEITMHSTVADFGTLVLMSKVLDKRIFDIMNQRDNGR